MKVLFFFSVAAEGIDFPGSICLKIIPAIFLVSVAVYKTNGSRACACLRARDIPTLTYVSCTSFSRSLATSEYFLFLTWSNREV